MLGEYWLPTSLAILIAGLMMRQLPLAVVAMLLLATGGMSRIWNRFCLHRVGYRRRLSRRRVFFGETITYEVEITNRKPLPLPWLVVEDEIPDMVTLLKGTTHKSHDDRYVLSQMLPMNMYHRVIRRFPIQCNQRGAFAFGPVEVRSGDLFGLFRRRKNIHEVDYLTVFPRLLPLEQLGISSRVFFGDIRLKHHLFQDPLLTAGARAYQAGDSIKHIHWKGSARRGKLQTRVFEPTTMIQLSLFLDVRTLTAMLWGNVVQLQEIGIIAAASISRHALEMGYGVGVHVNQTSRFSQGMISVPQSRHPDQLIRILEALAQIHQMEAMPMARFVHREAQRLPWGSTLVVISAQPFDDLLAVLARIGRTGRNVVLIKIGGEPIPKRIRNRAANVVQYHVRDHVAWNLINTVTLDDPGTQQEKEHRSDETTI